MCLDMLKRCLGMFKRVDGCYYGYKVFRVEDGKLQSQYRDGYLERKSNRWLKSIQKRIYVGAEYTSGFHVLARKKHTELYGSGFNYVVKRVKFRGVITTGTEMFNRWSNDLCVKVPVPVAVAKEMYICV